MLGSDYFIYIYYLYDYKVNIVFSFFMLEK